MSHFFMNDKNHLVNEAIEGLIQSAPYHNISRLEVDEDIRVVVRRDWDKTRVALISGGGSGHEPAHAGFVGKGMLTAAVCGDIFASPSVDAVLSAIVNVTGEAGCLLIIKNYTGDRLNFGLAAEKARGMGYKVSMVIVRDDIALPDNPQPRGIAGTVLVHKVAGYAAEQGQTLEQVTQLAEQTIEATASIGLAFATCHLPGEDRDERLNAGESELGMGIHGEPGVTTLATQNSREIVAAMSEKLLARIPQGKQVVLLLNNLGGFSMLEMALLVRETLASPLGKQVSHLIGPATLVSALDMKGFSLTTLVLSPVLEKALAAPVETSGWQPMFKYQAAERLAGKKSRVQSAFTPSENQQNARLLRTICHTLVALENQLNQLDAKVGDGDTGSTFAAGAGRLLNALDNRRLPLNETDKLLIHIGEQLALVMGGSSGVLMSIMFTSAGQKLSEGASFADALAYGLERMQHYGGARPGHRTMIDALDPAFKALQQGASLSEIAAAARQGAESTATMKSAKAGRSSYLNAHSLDGIKDPGASAVEHVFAALAKE
ncbi:dihydroxyacetone kinase [Erwinia sp. OLTSP20]|uniref:dihydroxyacetone kinase subunit DhaK n=1 Tax=unclassified Erwinia TaxID=2622719 RepID=UPI000C17EC89|nr:MULTISPECIES: dihydroxyacetone kinase subunit DhaK [unclassified Erwinia]PIJ50373.1 dihydroxyacetone kinase [Erwinia sp. OAMSP11]PIJ71632.1 dihydroxyacetone kinase [Erwinia sp. OLSSP12]PIJ81016.1 dihydroxyacetone kinase [Erwinia sp. OLCASP19]PIJ83274.1 dihydroxyacetone kinase [Erwinia sp. OLMTSP26]PIJ85954.1 dihydroxyacetone kinase [Erwinia sp. OLMDSP33]